ncbi:MAG TPA: hypothetical protein ENJ40_00745 [Thermosulfurimonas dismutans]|uniref:Helix-turn-helix domain-containing protein n=1 Tax=Thermosulfurimonas dismutans TaxID=999894 RepID=A0A7C3CS39_9BACT|nr:hypothetical protein [Thermosulfurimonas dismutans]
MSSGTGLGAYLREIRERQGLSLPEIAAETKISCRFLEAIEEERWEELPGEVYIVGYLRAYAEAVGLDPGDVLARYRETRPQKGRDTLGHPSGEVSPSRKGWWVVVGVVLLVLALILLYLWKF